MQFWQTLFPEPPLDHSMWYLMCACLCSCLLTSLMYYAAGRAWRPKYQSDFELELQLANVLENNSRLTDLMYTKHRGSKEPRKGALAIEDLAFIVKVIDKERCHMQLLGWMLS